MNEIHLNPKIYPKGSVVYWVKSDKNGIKHVEFGTVIDHFPGVICIQLYTINKKIRINGKPAEDFETPSRWQKLPKGWSYDWPLIDVIAKCPNLECLDVRDPNSILVAIEDGDIIKNQHYDWANFETEIDAHRGWRVVRKYPNHPPSCTTVDFDKVYDNYQDAENELEAYKRELYRQSELTDEEWSIEQIDETLHQWMTFCLIPEDTVQQYRDWIMKLEHIEDVDIRMCGQRIQWKYWKNKRWNDIEL